MTASKHFALTTAIVALFTASPALAGGRVFQNRTHPLATGVASQIHVNLGVSNPEAIQITGAPVDWTTEIEIVVKTRATANAAAEAVSDAIWVDLYARVMADRSLGGRVQQLTPGDAIFDDDQAEVGVSRLTWRFTVQHRTDSNSIS